ncbi:hypothetical protein KK137_06305 [Croceibacterium sp. LX-88]|uniref:HEPN domain-containing protein n=1 Tax=Croceibacterium selenioxidans TaxID=2838833 RepID=A0ABS5W2G8_9SPHN|nr:hypothetical protein [Croceibacterium selenioxidans]MBT2133941.1 hypothetical protein [Croceibacterium selenioxidans]
MAKISNDLFSMAASYDCDGAFLARMYVLCASIEIGLKAAILADDCTPERKAELPTLAHDLCKVVGRFEEIYGERMFDTQDNAHLAAATVHFKAKGLEYFTLPVLGSSLQGYSDLPELDAMQAIASKVSAFIRESEFFVNALSSHKPEGDGIIHFI